MQLNRRPNSGSEIETKPVRTARARSVGKLVRQFQGLEIRALDSNDLCCRDQDGSRTVTVECISRLLSVSATRHASTIQSEPFSPFVEFLL